MIHKLENKVQKEREQEMLKLEKDGKKGYLEVMVANLTWTKTLTTYCFKGKLVCQWILIVLRKSLSVSQIIKIDLVKNKVGFP